MRVNYNTQIEDTTAALVAQYLEEIQEVSPMSKAALTDAAIVEYIEKRSRIVQRQLFARASRQPRD